MHILSSISQIFLHISFLPLILASSPPQQKLYFRNQQRRRRSSIILDCIYLPKIKLTLEIVSHFRNQRRRRSSSIILGCIYLPKIKLDFKNSLPLYICLKKIFSMNTFSIISLSLKRNIKDGDKMLSFRSHFLDIHEFCQKRIPLLKLF